MPLYSYQVIGKNGAPGEIIEIIQRMDEPPLTRHPETGESVRRLISSPSIAGKWTDRSIKNEISDNKRLEQLGFTKYERTGKGQMERKAGHFGPKTISAD